MNLIGVDIHQLSKLRLRVLDKSFEPSFENMGKVNLELRPLLPNADEMQVDKLCDGDLRAGPINGSDEGAELRLEMSSEGAQLAQAASESVLTEGMSTCSSEIRRRVAGVETKRLPISMLPREPVLVQEYFEQTSSGRVRKGQKKEGKTLVIIAGGDKYHVPDHASDGLLEAIKRDKATGVKRPLNVWRDENDIFRWEFETSDEEAVYTDNTQTLKAADIPYGHWFDVLEIGEIPHSKGGMQLFARLKNGEEKKKYFLPWVIKELLVEHTKKKNITLKDLRGWQLLRSANGLVKTVPKSKRDEPPVVLKDSQGCKISNHVLPPSDEAEIERRAGSKRPMEQARDEESTSKLPRRG